jgi:hypothetical protein
MRTPFDLVKYEKHDLWSSDNVTSWMWAIALAVCVYQGYEKAAILAGSGLFILLFVRRELLKINQCSKC